MNQDPTPDNLDSNQALSNFVNIEAAKKGLSSKDAKKALKKLKSGGMMAQIAPQLHSQFMEMNPNLTAKEKLQMKLKKLRDGRAGKHIKTAEYEKTRQEMLEREEAAEQARIDKQKADEVNKRNHRKRLKELEKRLGVISQELYNQSMTNLKLNTYTDPGLRRRDCNIVELYGQQQKFQSQINMDELDEI